MISSILDKIRSLGIQINRNVQSELSSLSKSSVGLGNVDNTSDLNKPISTATQAALDNKTAVRGYITLSYGFIAAPADSTTYYYGFGQSNSLTTFETLCKIYVPRACVISAAHLSVYKSTGVASSENVSAYIRINATSDTTISTAWQWTTSFGFDAVSNTGLSISLAAGEYFTIKIVTPAWATNPANCYVNVVIETEES